MEKKERRKDIERGVYRTFPFKNEMERVDKERKKKVRGQHIFYRENKTE
jgi:hypothetical protein